MATILRKQIRQDLYYLVWTTGASRTGTRGDENLEQEQSPAITTQTKPRSAERERERFLIAGYQRSRTCGRGWRQTHESGGIYRRGSREESGVVRRECPARENRGYLEQSTDRILFIAHDPRSTHAPSLSLVSAPRLSGRSSHNTRAPSVSQESGLRVYG
jgi:hypothetical protein